MTVHPPTLWRRLAGVAALALLLGAAPREVVAVGASDANVTIEEKPPVQLTPTQEEAFKDVLKKVRSAKLRLWQSEWEKRIAAAKNLGLTEAQGRELADSAQNASVDVVDAWCAALAEMVRTKTLAPLDEAGVDRTISGWNANIDRLAEEKVRDDLTPFERAGWRVALRFHLGDEKYAKLKEEELKLDTERAEALRAALERYVEQHLDPWQKEVDQKISELRASLTLSEEQTKALRELGKQAIERSKTAAGKQVQSYLGKLTETRLKAFLNQGRMVGIRAEDRPTLQAEWKAGVDQIVGPDGAKQLREFDEQRKVRRARSLARILISQMDQHTALTSEQRARLQPLAEALVKNEEAFFTTRTESYHYLAPDIFLTAAGKAKPAELSQILDAAQVRHWQEACAPESRRRAVVDVQGDELIEEPKKISRRADTSDEEEAERRISEYLAERAAAQRRSWLAATQLQVEDLARAGGLPPEKVARLETAARGSVERALATWSRPMESSVRNSILGMEPRAIQLRLRELVQAGYSHDGAASEPTAQEIWKRAVEAAATPEQRVAWKATTDARQAYAQEATAQYILAEFDALERLTPQQWSALEPKMMASLKKYEPKIQRMFGSYRRSSWYLQPYSRMVPVFGVPEAELKKILTTEQWDRWTASSEFQNCSSYWSNIEQMSR